MSHRILFPIPNVIQLLVVIPIHRTSRNLDDFWPRIRSVIFQSHNAHFVFLLKTSNQTVHNRINILSEEFSTLISFFILDEDEYLWNSVLRVTTSKTQWILQIHTDDHFEGILDPSAGWDIDSVVEFDSDDQAGFLGLIRNAKKARRPAAFSAIPHSIWNVCQIVSAEMKNNVSPSMDQILDELVNLHGNRKHNRSFKYNYNPRNWNWWVRRIHLKKLMNYDVWRGNSLEIAVINRNLDVVSVYPYALKNHLISSLSLEGVPFLGSRPFGLATRLRLLINSIFVVLQVRIRKSLGLQSSTHETKRAVLKFVRQMSKIVWRIEDLVFILENISLSRFDESQVARINFWLKSLVDLKELANRQ